MAAVETEKPSRDWLRERVVRALRSFGRIWSTPARLPTTLAIVIGAATGVGAWGFSWLVHWVQRLYFSDVGGALASYDLKWWLLPLLPMSGALLVGLITHFFAPEAEGHGVPEVMDAMARQGGRIRPRVAGAKAVASALTIGTGGSAGTEGPIIQIGAVVGSSLGQWLRLNLNDMRILIGCGAAAGIAAIFNAPIAGVLFAIEVLLRDISRRSFVPIIIAAVLSSTVMQFLQGGHNDPLFPVPAQLTGLGGVEPIYQFAVAEFANFAVLGVVCGLVAVTFVKLLYFCEDVFHKLPLHRVARPVLGGLLVGLTAIGTHAIVREHLPHVKAELGANGQYVTHELDTTDDPPAVMGNGYPIITQTLQPEAYEHGERIGWAFWILIILGVGRLLATVLTLGSGGSGGVFAPSLFMGATVGGAFGLLLQHTGWFPGLNPGAYALVGMAAVVAASIHAPLTATLILFEMTRDYKVVVPIMLAAVIALAVARSVEPASIYTMKLLRRGVRAISGDLRLLQQISVRDIPRQKAALVTRHDPVDKLVHLMRTTSAGDFVVVDGDGCMAGMVIGDDLRTILLEQEAVPLLLVSDVMRDDVLTVDLDETLDTVLEKFAGQPWQGLPVIDSAEPGVVHEMISRVAVMNRYHQSVARAGARA